MTVHIEKNDSVWTIIHDRPEARNSVDTEHAYALVDAFQQFEDSDAHVAVFCGAGDHFCAGWDLKLAASLSDPETRDPYLNMLAMPIGSAPTAPGALGPSRMELSKPVIAAIEGAAVAGGMELALWADIRVMAETAYMGVFCRRWGIPLMDGGSVRLPRLVGQGKALEIAMTGRKVEAEECIRIGLAERVVAHGQARIEAEALAHEIARFPQEAVRADRRTIIESRGMSVRAGLQNEWANGLASLRNQGVNGAGRFRDGAGRHGDFQNI
ncbi:crotonase/enoyl-CoA hydratase family protein [Pseudovibrio sp. Tun.PSC04-5.I4]|uniref:crotonase/enoyl-CoA hydratase family protein n=1 Tax=Pseudovibrio sp. Tun.PSC04-5.I4 TaxID=1798213 RepID=UPI000889F0D9|nr:crotonase/enoyl-CoA hydratase family protein [Pseudovibrio sp. Tun.PSC04-5.I4]SDR48037.1 enoyl-CoA hydratase [Pseudovibrio sp. Tun.PSC04-5.I4]